ncbi:MAG: hypothetical protein VW405_12370, partial [Rhodospirillaceae bacterium]
MAELPVEAEETADLPDGLIPPIEVNDEEAGLVPEPSAVEPAPVVSHGAVLVRDRYLVDTGKPLSNLDTPSAKAYAVEDRRDLGRQLYALVCTPGVPV